MASLFPESFDNFINPNSGSHLGYPSHREMHVNVHDAISATQARLGISGSTNSGSIDYQINSLNQQATTASNQFDLINQQIVTAGNEIDLLNDGIETINKIRVRNETGSTLFKNQLVTAVGFNPAENAYLVQIADKDEPNLDQAIAILTQDLPNLTTDLALTYGVIENINTLPYQASDSLTLGNSGRFTNLPLDIGLFTGHIQTIGKVVRPGEISGSILLSIDNILPITADSVFNIKVSLGRGVYSGLEASRAGGLDLFVSSGIGFLTDAGSIKRILFGGDTLTLPPSSVSHFLVDKNAQAQFTNTDPNFDTELVLGCAITSETDIVFLASHHAAVAGINAKKHEYAHEVVGPISVAGCVANVNLSNSLGIDVTGGSFYIADLKREVEETDNITFSYWHHTGSFEWLATTLQNQIDTTHYNASGSLLELPSGSWKKDMVYITSNDGVPGVEYHVVYAQEYFDEQDSAIDGNQPLPPSSFFSHALRCAGIVVQSGSNEISTIVDERPFLGQHSSRFTTPVHHGDLLGLLDNDHPQYELKVNKDLSNGYAGLNSGSSISDAAHGNKTGGNLHAPATTSSNGFMSSSDKSKLNGIETGAQVNLVTSVFGRTGSILPVINDYSASYIINDSSVPGTTIKLALNTLSSSLSASFIKNDSSVVGATAKDAFNTLSSSVVALTTNVSPMIWGANSVAATNVNRYLFPCYMDALAPTSPIFFNAPNKVGTIKNMQVYQNTPSGNGLNLVYTLRVNQTGSLVAVTLASTATTGSNLVNSASIPARALLDIEVTKTSSVGTSPGNIVCVVEYS
jgi:hypothetical protein